MRRKLLRNKKRKRVMSNVKEGGIYMGCGTGHTYIVNYVSPDGNFSEVFCVEDNIEYKFDSLETKELKNKKYFKLIDNVDNFDNNSKMDNLSKIKVGQVWGFRHSDVDIENLLVTKIDSNDGIVYFNENGDFNYVENILREESKYYLISDSENEDKHSFNDILSSLGKMLSEKDKRYGNSALNPLGIFAEHHPYGARLDEKLSRVQNSDELRKNDVADIMGGLVLICRDRGWNDFSDQID